MSQNFCEESGFPTQKEKSLCPSIRPVVDSYSGCSDHLCSSRGFVEWNPCEEVVKAVLGEIDGPITVVSDDFIDHSPREPCAMKAKSTFTAICDRIQDFGWDFQSEYNMFMVDETHKLIGDHGLFTGLNRGWGTPWNFKILGGLCGGGFVADDNMGEFLSIIHKGNLVSSSEGTSIDNDSEGGAPHDAMFFVLSYLGGTQDLLSVELVCRSFRDAVREDPQLWRSIHIDGWSLCGRFTDDTLLKLTSRAQGTLQCLSLVNCMHITDEGLRCVFQNNPRISKLNLLGCSKLTMEGILFNLVSLKSSGTTGIKQLRVAGPDGYPHVTEQQFIELIDLLDADNFFQMRDQYPRFYHGGRDSFLISEDDWPIDVEVCPLCQEVRQVYDCPGESSQLVYHPAQPCRGCIRCISRCGCCGMCIDPEFERKFFVDCYCFDCWNQLEKDAAKSNKSAINDFFFCG